MTLHEPLRPAWKCHVCTEPWPCQTRQRELLAEFHGTPQSLGILMSRYFATAMQDRPLWADEGIYERMLGWIRPH